MNEDIYEGIYNLQFSYYTLMGMFYGKNSKTESIDNKKKL